MIHVWHNRTALSVVVLGLLMLLAGCKVLQVERAQQAVAGDWITEGNSPMRQQVAASAPQPPLEEQWRYNAEAGFGAVSPLLLGDAILVATRRGEVHGIHLPTGDGLGSEEFGESIEGTPVIDNGVMYVPVEWGRRSLVAYDLSRSRRLWAHKGPSISAGLLLLGDRVIAANKEGAVVAFDKQDGTERWRNEERTVPIWATPLATDYQHVLVADEKGHVRLLSYDEGHTRWEQSLGRPVLVAPTASEDGIFLATTRGRFVALDTEDGSIRWQYTVPDTTVRFAPPALAGDHVLFGGTDGILRALDTKTGREIWSTQLEDALSAAPLVASAIVYVGTMGRELVAMALSDGTVQWRQILKGRIKSALAARDGALVVLTEPKYVYLFKSKQPEYAATE